MNEETRSEMDARTEAPRQKTDLDAFFDILPKFVESFARKHNDPKTASDMAINLAREEAGHLCQIGDAVATTMCRDGRPLALLPGMQVQGPITSGLGGKQGAMVAHFESQNITRIQGL